MPKKAPELSAWHLRRLTKSGMHAVGGVAGLHLDVRTITSRCWILRVKPPGGKRRDLGLGAYPEITLEKARERARLLREQLLLGTDPVQVRKQEKQAAAAEAAKRLTFEECARACFAAKSQEFKNAKHTEQWINQLEKYAFPKIGKLWVQDVGKAQAISVLEPVWQVHTETATRVRGRCESVIAWAQAADAFKGDNPFEWKRLKPLLPAPNKIKKVEHLAAVPWQRMPEFMHELRKDEQGEPTVYLRGRLPSLKCLRFMVLTAARGGEARGALHSEMDLDAKCWSIQGERMKAKKPHRVPLCDEAVQIVKDMRALNPESDLVFPSFMTGKQLSENALGKVVDRITAQMPGCGDVTPHGMRSSFKDWARSQSEHDDEASELALAHVSTDKTRAAYARDELFNKRIVLMRDWAKFCAQKPAPVSVVPIKRAARGAA